MIKMIEQIDNSIVLFSIKNEYLEVIVTNYGCTIISVRMNDMFKNVSDVVLGYDDMTTYKISDGYLGAIVGRVANRIKSGHFILNNKEYHLAINNGPNHLHGGINGFSYQVFNYAIINQDTIEFYYLSNDMEEGYPGNLTIKVTYQLDKQTLIMRYWAVSDQDTLLNLTNHSYFNLSGKADSILNHQLQVNADRFACIDENGLPNGEFRNVFATPFDFSERTLISDALKQEDQQLRLARGIDHSFIFNKNKNQVVLWHRESGRRLTVSSTLPTAHIYTANYLDGRVGKYGQQYYPQSAICIETQFMADSIHLEDIPKVILKKGQIYEESTSYTFEVINHEES